MAVTCSEVMYGAYYPYIYSRTGPGRSFYQYERQFNQDMYSSSGIPLNGSITPGISHSPRSPATPPAIASAISPATNVTTQIATVGKVLLRNIAKEKRSTGCETDIANNHSESRCSSDAPESPCENSKKPNFDDTRNECPAKAQYLSASCVVFTHYSSDTATVVDEHFTRALNDCGKHIKGPNSLTTRNFPASFWNSNYVPSPSGSSHQVSDFYTTDGSYADAWVPHAAHYTPYAHAAHAHAYHHNMAQYGGLLRLPQQYSHGTRYNRLHHDQSASHALESGTVYASYPTMAGLDPQVPEASKDLYWF